MGVKALNSKCDKERYEEGIHHEGKPSSGEEVERRAAFRLVALLFPFILSLVLKFTRGRSSVVTSKIFKR